MKKLPTRKALQHRQQKGAVLIVALIMLLLITMASIATIRATTMDERMAGNARDRDKAFQAAEAAVRTCLKRLTDPVNPSDAYPLAKILPPEATGLENWEKDTDFWRSNSEEVSINEFDTSPSAKLFSNPRCIAERLGTGDNYRVTGRAVGGSESSVVILQATYSGEN